MKTFLKYLGKAASIICYAIVFFGILFILEYFGFSHYAEKIDAEFEAGAKNADPKIAENVNRENFNKIKINASYAEVCALLGGEGQISLDKYETGEPPVRCGDYVWYGPDNETKIFVLFDKDNKVALKRFIPLPTVYTIPGKPFKFEEFKNLKGISYEKLCSTAYSPGLLFNEGRGDMYRLKDRKTHLSKDQTVSLYFFTSLVKKKEQSSDGDDEECAEELADPDNPGYELGVFRAVFVDGKYRDDVIMLPMDEEILATSNLL
ncbi:hypothetical protein IJT93_01640 [bacterium]|nr:hypothetical protein [bacterium]